MRAALFVLLPALMAAQTSLLRVRAVDNDGADRVAGARSAGLSVEVTDELGKPVAGAVVTVRLPDDGASGSFANGLSSAILTTGADGRAATSPISWNRVAGIAEIRITAVSGKLRAGTIASRKIAEAPPETQAVEQEQAQEPPQRHGPRVILKQGGSGGGGSHLKLILIAAVAAGATGAVAALSGGKKASSAGAGTTGGTGIGTVTSITAAGAPTIVHP